MKNNILKQRKLSVITVGVLGTVLLIGVSVFVGQWWQYRNAVSMPIGTSGLSYRVVGENTIEVYSEYADKTWNQEVEDARSIRIIPKSTYYGEREPYVQTSSELYVVFHDRYGPELRKLADTPDVPAQAFGDSFVIVHDTVYAEDGGVQDIADAGSLELLSINKPEDNAPTYYRDSAFVYEKQEVKGEWNWLPRLVKLQYDVASFEVFANSYYTKDVNGVYFKGEPVTPVSTSFVLIATPELTGSNRMPRPYSYAKIADALYHDGEVMQGVDPEQFKILPASKGNQGHDYGYDAEQVYYQGEALEGSDPETFEVLGKWQYEGCSAGPFAKDMNTVYYGANRLEDADAETFEVIDNSYGRDKNGYWDKTLFYSKFDELPVCEYT